MKITSLPDPFTTTVENGPVTNESFVGQWPDLLRILQGKCNFSSYLRRPEDGNWGTKDENGVWNGLIRKLITYFT